MYPMKVRNMFLMLMLILACMMPMIQIVSANPGNEIWATPSTTAVTWGDTFYVNIDANVDEPISGWMIEYINFTTAQFNTTNVGISYFFADNGTSATDTGTIDNPSGVIGGSMVDYTYETAAGGCYQNNVNKTLVNLTLLADGVGTGMISYETPDDTGKILLYSGAGKSSADHYCNVTVHPYYPSGSTATVHNQTRIDLAWSSYYSSRGVDKIVVFANTTSSPVSRNPIDEIYNSTGSSYQHEGLTPSTTYYYSYWTYNDTENLYSLIFQQASDTTYGPNSPPTITNPIPADETDGVSKTLASWSCTINDPEGDNFNYSVKCSNGNWQSQNGITNGTKNLVLGNGLEWSTKYYVWVNATDGNDNSGQWTNETFWFWVHNNSAPINSNPVPTNGATGQELNPTLYITINDPEGEGMVLYIMSNASGSWSTVGWTTTIYNSTQHFLPGCFSDYSTKYWWSANTTDTENNWDNDTYYFTTKADSPPGGGGPGGGDDYVETPTNNAPDVATTVGDLKVTVSDPDGDNMDVSFYWANDTLIGTDTGVISGSVAEIAIPTLNWGTLYQWYVNVTDGTLYTVAPSVSYWNFTTHNCSTCTIDIEKTCNESTIQNTTMQINYTVVVTYTGNGLRTGITVNDTFDSSVLTYHSTSGVDAINITTGSDWILYNISNLTVGQSFTFYIKFDIIKHDTGTKINNTVIVNTTEGVSDTDIIVKNIGESTTQLRVTYQTPSSGFLGNIYAALTLVIILAIVAAASLILYGMYYFKKIGGGEK